MVNKKIIADTYVHNNGDIYHRYPNTSLLFTIVDNFIYCYDEKKPKINILQAVVDMGRMLISYGISLQDFKQDFGNKNLFLADWFLTMDTSVDLLTE
ncbi:hypothetical protein [Yersinia enterocolitica]|uniref:hypothetical protein n=1 Tax=Yersinia enterocolitica TaxID=630 RepID=UPI003D06DD8F